jgi:hypothetical protein
MSEESRKSITTALALTEATGFSQLGITAFINSHFAPGLGYWPVQELPDENSEHYAAVQLLATNGCPMEFNDMNFWMVREAMRFTAGWEAVLGARYTRPDCWARLTHYRHDIHFHFLHVSVDDPTMVSYTPSIAYGMADRQVRLKLGRYLTKFYSNYLTAAEIKAIVDRAAGALLEIKWGATRDEFRRVYAEGPGSCMAGTDFSGPHPAEAYASGDFKIAHVCVNDTITARCVVHEPSMVFVRLYGDDADRLHRALETAGYTKTDCWPSGARLLCLRHHNGFVLPYIDGEYRGVKLKETKNGEEFHLTHGGTYTFYCNETSGFYSEEEDEDTVCCEYCNDTVNADDATETLDDGLVCSNCLDNDFVRAIVNTRTGTAWIRSEHAIYCESSCNHYHDTMSILGHYGIVCCDITGEYYEEEEIRYIEDGTAVHHSHVINVSDDRDAPRYHLISDLSDTGYFAVLNVEGVIHRIVAEECMPDEPPSSMLPLMDALMMDLDVEMEPRVRRRLADLLAQYKQRNIDTPDLPVAA